MGVSTSRWLGGVLLLVAGAYQFTGAKEACLRQCRTPLGFLLNHWRNGGCGAIVMGVRHGAVSGMSLGADGLLFVLGVVNLWWIALVAAVVLVERLVRSDVVTRIFGGFSAVWGTVSLIGLVS